MSFPPGVFDWTEDAVTMTQRLWREGKSAAEIARAIKNPSRSSVIGKLHRLKLQGDGRGQAAEPRKPKAVKPPKPTREPRAQARVFGETRVKPAVVFGAIPATGTRAPFHGKAAAFRPLPGSQPKVWTERAFGECAWIVGGEGADVLACCEPAQGSWCATHHLIGHQKPTPGQPRTANDLARSLRRHLG